MDPSDVEQLIENGIEGAEAQATGAGDRFDLIVIADQFDDLSAVKRQQRVYATIKHLIADGTIHAVNIRTFTRAQWQAVNDNNQA